MKVNKWEINAEWSRKSEVEPWIRIEILRGGVVAEYLVAQGLSLVVEGGRCSVLKWMMMVVKLTRFYW
ncbi:hypothetical protein DL544_06210 [Stenotrophomonas sp. pho]|nr:hypothetical protein DL544_06210 [Stenotrophomonas sp. pho]